jgi:hypothetical protein
VGDAGESDTTTVISDAGGSLSATAPKSYVVKRGDTLWGLANLFLRDPYLWPEIWYVNPQVQNPHRIYPGDTLRLAYGADGTAQIQLTRGSAARLEPLLRSSPLDGPIATIPYSAIAAFLSKPGVISKDEVKTAPYVLALRNEHVIAGAGFDLYVKKLTAAVGERYNIMHVDAPLKDPTSGDVLGYMAIYTGTGQVTRAGNPATMTLTESARETLRGDVLLADTANTTPDLVPHAPARPVNGQVMAVVNGVLLIGQYQVVAINRGSRAGIEPGHVLQVSEAVKTERDRCAHIEDYGTCLRFSKDSLPIETAGTLLVFKTYDRMSYALVVSEVSPIHVTDRVSNP